MPLRSAEPAPLAFLERQPYHPWLVVGVCCISGFIGQLDASIVQLALPTLQQTFKATVNDVRWVAIAYLLAYAACLPVFSRICEIAGRKLLFIAGFALFGGASLLCGLAEDLSWLIAFRALQGIGGSLLGANSMSLLVKSVSTDKRATAIGCLTASQAIGVSVGPIVGGLLLASFGWQWLFWAAVPFAIAAVVLGWLVLPQTVDIRTETLDWLGGILLVPSVLLAVLALNQTSVWPLLSLPMIACVLGAAISLFMFGRRERRAAFPLIDLSLFGRGAFNAGIVGVALGYALLYGMLFLASYALLHGWHNSARITGLKLALIPIALGLFAPPGIALSHRWGFRVVGTVGMALCTVALLTFASIGLWLEQDSLGPGLIGLFVFGAGLGLFMAPNSSATIAAVPADHSSTAAGMVNLMRVLGSCLGVSAASSMMSSWLQQRGGRDSLDVLLSGHTLLDAIESSLAVLVIFAVTAAVLSLRRPPASRAD
jgi:EmrB/QacA subfamily drug resistance transporter